MLLWGIVLQNRNVTHHHRFGLSFLVLFSFCESMWKVVETVDRGLPLAGDEKPVDRWLLTFSGWSEREQRDRARRAARSDEPVSAGLPGDKSAGARRAFGEG